MKSSILKLNLIALTLAFSLASIAQERIVFHSANLKCDDTVLVFKPKEPGKYSSEATPLLFLLHGWSGKYSDWSRKVDLQKISDTYGFIIVTPDGFYNGWYLNNIDSAKMQWRTFFHKELYPDILSRFKTSPDRVFITGLSMGGHGAVNIYMDDTSKFAAAGSMSGVLNLQETRLKLDQIAQILGPWSEENRLYDSESAINRIDRLKGSKKLVVITSGAQDSYAKGAQDFQKRAEELKVPTILILSPGVHSWKYWTYALEEHLRIFGQILNRSNMGY